MTVPSYLIVVPSSCQMYSGTGTAIFDWIRFAKKDFRFSMLMDVENENNFKIANDFCLRNDVKLFSSQGLALPGCIDSGIRTINDHLSKNDYDFIECVSWANASTNLNVLASKKKFPKLVFVPHSQPLWTLSGYERYFMTSVAFRKTLNAADFIFIDSPDECEFVEFNEVTTDKIHFVPLGVNTELFCPENSRVQTHQILSICDCYEHRKRIDLTLKAFRYAFALNKKLRLVLGGMGSDTIELPNEISCAVTRLGYVDQNTLIELYRTSSLFILLTDYEAFGLPIAEALSTGCPVLLNRLAVLESLFSNLPGVTFVDNKDTEATARLICQLADSDVNRRNTAVQASQIFSLNETYGKKRSILLNIP